MKSQTRSLLAFVAFGCVAGGAIGWGVWINSTPSESWGAGDSSHSRMAHSETRSTTSSPLSSTTTATSVMPSPDDTQRKHSPAPVSQSDPFLAPNAFIPPSNMAPAVPTRVFSPSTITESSPASAPLTPSTAQRPAQTVEPVPATNTPLRESAESADEPAVVTPPPSEQPTEPSPEPPTQEPTTVVSEPAPQPEPTPTTEAVSPPTLVQPVPTTETLTTNPEEPTPIEPGTEPTETQEPLASGGDGSTLPTDTTEPTTELAPTAEETPIPAA